MILETKLVLTLVQTEPTIWVVKRRPASRSMTVGVSRPDMMRDRIL